MVVGGEERGWLLPVDRHGNQVLSYSGCLSEGTRE
jgi:hypothetical protein